MLTQWLAVAWCQPLQLAGSQPLLLRSLIRSRDVPSLGVTGSWKKKKTGAKFLDDQTDLQLSCFRQIVLFAFVDRFSLPGVH
jgi:hypothetical protein